MFSDAIIEPLQKTIAYKGCKITAQYFSVFLQFLPYQLDLFGIGATFRINREMLCFPYAGFIKKSHYKQKHFIKWYKGILREKM